MIKYCQIILLFLFINISAATSQELRRMFMGNALKMDNSEMVARKDQNGKYCAAIQVISDMDGFSYDSNNGIVGKIEDKPGKDMVYLTANERTLEIFKSGYKPSKLILSEYGISLAPQQVWQLEVTGEKGLETFQITLQPEPADAFIFIDGEPINENEVILAKGDYYIRTEKIGFKTLERIISVDSRHVFFDFKMKRLPDVGVQILSNPDGAIVNIDGVRLGTTPVSAFFPPGQYPISITKEGYFTVEDQTIEIKPPLTKKTYSLEENVGKLTVNSFASAEVYFNDQKVVNPIDIKLAPQMVQIKVVMPNAIPIEQQVLLHTNEEVELNLYPDVQVGTIQVATTPFDSHIELIGTYGQKYEADGMNIFNEIPIDTYTIKVTSYGYLQSELIVVLTEDAKVNKNIQLVDMQTATFNMYSVEMVHVTGGAFIMGCESTNNYCEEDEKPPHKVVIDNFHIGKYEITQKQWEDVMEVNPSYFSDCENCPVENVSWNDIQKFISKLNIKTGNTYRLPSEAEWEYVARGGKFSNGYLYAGSNNIDDVAWYWRNSGDNELEDAWSAEILQSNDCKTKIIGQKNANEIGIHDMSGNVWEWCSDYYKRDYYQKSPEVNPKNSDSDSNRVCRGGSWGRSKNQCTISSRGSEKENSRQKYLGFRLAHDSDKK